jgi:P-loop Domain of unknown function (DUF2791)
LGVRVIIDDDTWYDYIKLMAKFVADIGYKGLIIILDEAIHLAKISKTLVRQNNYDKLLAMFNDALQGRVSHLGTLIGGTPQFLEDPRRGLYTDPAWQRRTRPSRLIVQSDLGDSASPVVRLEPLSKGDILKLLQRLIEVHQIHHSYQSRLTAKDLQEVLTVISDRIGSEALLTPGEIVRDFIGVLNVMHQNPKMSLQQLLQTSPTQNTSLRNSKVQSEFAEFTV